MNEVAVLTDGLQKLALHYQSQTAHTPFFRPIFAWLRQAPDDYAEKFASSLAGYLDSPKVNECTDDDKTLVLATRAPAVAGPQPDGRSPHEHGDVATAVQ